MMRRGPLSTYPVESLLADAARERVNGVLVLAGGVTGRIYLVEGDVYFVERGDEPPLEQRLVAGGVFTQDQVDNHGVQTADGLYLARALDTDLTIDEDALDAFLLDASARALSGMLGHDDGDFELDPYGTHPAGVLSSWPPDVVMSRAAELREEAERLEAERLEQERLEAERLEQERLEAERLEAERLEAERLEQERLEQERLEQERLEAERLEQERLEAEQAEAERLEQERLAAEQAEAERLEAEREERLRLAGLPGPAGETPHERYERMSPLAVPLEERKEGGLGTLEPATVLVLPEEPPSGAERVEVAGVEWRVLVRAGRGDSVGAIAAQLDLSLETVQAVVEGLWTRGLVEIVHTPATQPA